MKITLTITIAKICLPVDPITERDLCFEVQHPQKELGKVFEIRAQLVTETHEILQAVSSIEDPRSLQSKTPTTILKIGRPL